MSQSGALFPLPLLSSSPILRRSPFHLWPLPVRLQAVNRQSPAAQERPESDYEEGEKFLSSGSCSKKLQVSTGEEKWDRITTIQPPATESIFGEEFCNIVNSFCGFLWGSGEQSAEVEFQKVSKGEKVLNWICIFIHHLFRISLLACLPKIWLKPPIQLR